MNVSIGTLTLGENFKLRGLENAVRMGFETQPSDDGVNQILVTPLSGGGIELELDGWYTRAQETSLMEMAEACEKVDLAHPKFTGKVLVTGSGLEDLFEYVNPDEDDIRTGPIYLITV